MLTEIGNIGYLEVLYLRIASLMWDGIIRKFAVLAIRFAECWNNKSQKLQKTSVTQE